MAGDDFAKGLNKQRQISITVTGRNDEAVRRWEEYQQRNRLAKPQNWKGNVQ